MILLGAHETVLAAFKTRRNKCTSRLKIIHNDYTYMLLGILFYGGNPKKATGPRAPKLMTCQNPAVAPAWRGIRPDLVVPLQQRATTRTARRPHSPASAQWRGWWRSCRNSEGRRTPPHSSRRHSLRVQ